MRAGQVFTDGDMTNILAAIALTARLSSGADSPHAGAWRQGFAAAIGAVAVAVGVSPAALAEHLAPFDVGRLSTGGQPGR